MKLLVALLAIFMTSGGSVLADTWNGTVAKNIASGTGTAADPYLINTAAEFAYFGSKMNNNTQYWKLGADINLDNREWTYGEKSAATFKGHFDGGNHTISNLNIVPVSQKNNGLFCALEGANNTTGRADVHNLTIDYVTIATSSDLASTTNTGALVGCVNQYTDIDSIQIKNVTISFTNLTNTNYVGVFAGIVKKNSNIKNCSVDNSSITISGAISGGGCYIGGAIGQIEGTDAEGNSTIDSLIVKSPSVTVNKVAVKDCRIGAVFGRIHNFSDVKNVNVSSPSLVYKVKESPNVDLRLGSFAGEIYGSAARKTVVAGTVMTGESTLTIGTGTENISNVRLGVVGIVQTGVLIDGWVLNGNLSMDVKGNLTTSTSYLGGMIGYVLGGGAGAPVSIKNIEIGGNFEVKVSGYTKDATSYLGGIIGYLISGDAIGAEVVVDSMFVGGKAAVTIAGTIGNSVPNSKGGYDYKGNVYVGGFAGNVQGRKKVDNFVRISKVFLDGGVYLSAEKDIISGSYFAGLAGYLNTSCQLSNCVVKNPEVVISGSTASTTYIAGLIGLATGDVDGAYDFQASVSNVKTVNPKVSVKGDILGSTSVGGAVGQLNKYSSIDGVVVKGGSITGPTEKKIVKNNIEFWVGGALGKQNSSGSGIGQPNYVHNVAVSNININLGNYEPESIINNHKFAVGGVIATVNTPNKDANGRMGMPENLYFRGGKIYAPFAATSPTVANFNASVASYNNYTGENFTTILDGIEKSVKCSWLYSDYKLGLSDEFLNCGAVDDWNAAPAQYRFRKNYQSALSTESGVAYLLVNRETFLRQNRYLDNERPSKTVLWWTNTGTRDDTKGSLPAATLWTEYEQPIYPKHDATFAQINSNLADYPYYMYFYQGVANAQYVSEDNVDALIYGIETTVDNAIKSAQSGADPVVLTLSDHQAGQRGWGEHQLEVTPNNGLLYYDYRWYVDGVEISGQRSNTLSVVPGWKTGKHITVNAYVGLNLVASANYNLRVGAFKTKAGDAEKVGSNIYGRGTKTNPYVIDSPEALRQLSMLSTYNTSQLWETLVKPTKTDNTNGVDNQPQGHYNRAYYIMDADVDLGSETFIPISHVGASDNGTDGTYTANWVFQGNFDGKGHKIRNLHITWGAGKYNGNGSFQYHGLFGAIGHSTAIGKWGDGTTTSPTVVQNLVIDGAVLTHDTNNKSFYYGNGSIETANANNCMVGVLAGVVAQNTTIKNIEVHHSTITDMGSTTYNLATKGLYVGGIIGSMQGSLSADNTNRTMPLVVQNLMADVDIALTHANFNTQPLMAAEVPLFNVGGIVGRVSFANNSATQSVVQEGMPRYTLYTGTINAPKAWISPVLGSLRYASQNGYSAANNSKQWEGNNNTAETQLEVADALFYDYKIVVRGETLLVDDQYPSNVCAWGARSVTEHANGADMYYVPIEYQGVNYNAKYMYGNEMAIDPEHTGGHREALSYMNSHADVDAYWVWTDGDDAPHIDWSLSECPFYARLEASSGVENQFQVVADDGSTNHYYVWEVNGVPVEGNESFNTINPDVYQHAIIVRVYDVEGGSLLSSTQYVFQDRDFVCSGVVEKKGLAEYVASLKDTKGNVIEDGDDFEITYQWYLGNLRNGNKAQMIDGATASTTTISTNALRGHNFVLCKVTIRLKSEDVILFDDYLSLCVVEVKTVYLMTKTASKFTDSRGRTHEYAAPKKSEPNYGSVDNPVDSWADAYNLLAGYTEPTQDFYNGLSAAVKGTTTWTSATVYDFTALYEANPENYPYDVIKRNGHRRNVKPIEDCTSNWVTNRIVVMGKAKEDYTRNQTDDNATDNKNACKPATITGRDDDTDYYGMLVNTASGFSINADHHFEYIGFGVGTNDRYRMYAHRWDVWMGDGILIGWAAALHTNELYANVDLSSSTERGDYRMNNADASTGTPENNYAADIAVLGGYENDASCDNPEFNEYINHGRADGQHIALNSGFWGPVCPGNRQSKSDFKTYYVAGGPEYPVKTTITVDIDRAWNDVPDRNLFKYGEHKATVDVGCMLTGNHEGTTYSDVKIDVQSGRIGRIVNGIKGAQRRSNNSTTGTFKTNGHWRQTLKLDGAWVEASAGPCDSYFGRGVIHVHPKDGKDETVSIIELYCGGLGRAHNDGKCHPEVMTYFYGLSEVNIEGGTFRNTIYGSGAGGVSGIGTAKHHTDDFSLPYWNTTSEDVRANAGGEPYTDHVWYAPYEYVKNNGFKFVKVKVASDNSQDPYLTPQGYVDLEKTRNIIRITGGTFGSPADSAFVSIYAGGNGETNAALVNPGPANTALGVSNQYNTPNHQAGNMYGSEEPGDYTSIIEISGDNTRIYGNVYGGGKGSSRYYLYFCRTGSDADAKNEYSYAPKIGNDQTYVWYNQTGDAAYADMVAANSGAVWRLTQQQRLNADNYLNLGQVYGNTKVTISGKVKIFGNVYAGGEGVPDMSVKEFFKKVDPQFGLTNAATNSAITLEKMLERYGTAPALDADGNPTGASTGRRTAYIQEGDTWVSFPQMGKLFGNAELIIKDGVEVYGNVYGGGQAGSIEGYSSVEISNASILGNGESTLGNVYGAGEGVANTESKDYTKVATIKGDSHVIVNNSIVAGNIYGGGEKAVVTGNTNVSILGKTVVGTDGNSSTGSVYGGGQGIATLKDVTDAYVTGNTSVVIGE